MPLDPMVYAKMLGERIADGRTRVYLVNTGWIGGGYGVGHRIELAYTRALVARALDGTIEDSEFVHDDIFNVDIPTTCHGVPDGILVPLASPQTQNHHKGDRHLCGGFARADDSGYNTPDISSPSPDGDSASALVTAP